MPVRTFQFAAFNNGQVVLEYDVNDANWRVSVIRCINNSDAPAFGRVYEAGAQIFSATCPAHQTVTWNASGIQLGWQPDYWNSITEQWEPGGIELGDYELSANWPWRG